MRQAGSSTSLTSPNPYTCGVGFLIAHCRAEETISRRLRPFCFVFYFVYRIFKRTHLTRGQFLQDYSKESGSGETGLSPGRKSQLTSALRSCGFFGFAFSCLFAVSRRHTLPPLLSRNRHQGDRGQLLAPLGPKGVHKSSGHSGKARRIDPLGHYIWAQRLLVSIPASMPVAHLVVLRRVCTMDGGQPWG